MSLGKPVIKDKGADMDESMKKFAIDNAERCLENANNELLVANYMKQCFEKTYQGVWHCIVGRNFSGFVTHEQNKYIFFYIG